MDEEISPQHQKPEFAGDPTSDLGNETKETESKDSI